MRPIRPLLLSLICGLGALAATASLADDEPGRDGGPGPAVAAAGVLATTSAGGAAAASIQIPVAGYDLVADYRFGTGPEANIRSKADLARFGQFRYHWSGDTGDTLSGNGEWQRYRDYPDGDPRSNHVFTPDSLKLTARLAGGLYNGGIESGMWLTFATFKHGYFEAEMKVPGGAGMWPAFWIMSDKAPGQDYRWPPEIDFLDLFNENRSAGDNTPPRRFAQGCATAGHDAAHDHRILYSDPAVDPKWGLYYLPDGQYLHTGFHRWGAEWTPDDVWTFYFDGKVTKKVRCKWIFSKDGNGKANPGYLIVNLATGGNWFTPNDPTAFPGELEIRYMRVYQRHGQHDFHGPIPRAR